MSTNFKIGKNIKNKTTEKSDRYNTMRPCNKVHLWGKHKSDSVTVSTF